MVKWSAGLSGLCGFVVALGFMTASARADVTTERGASILAFPKVLADGAADTIIQITNVSNSMVHARCFYVNAQLENPSLPEGPNNRPLWQETDFTIWLTKQQPTHWQVSTGRFVNPLDSCFRGNAIVQNVCSGNGAACTTDGQCNTGQTCVTCQGAGIDPGAVPPVPHGFMGELKCVEVDAAGNPIGGNHLKGEATIKTTGGDVAKYNAIGIQGTELAGGTGNTLLLDQPKGNPDPVGEYNACPETLIVNHYAEGVTDPVVLAALRGGTCSTATTTPCQGDADCPAGETCNNAPQVRDATGARSLRSATATALTLVPCSQDFENQIPGQVTMQFLITNEFEQQFSASTTVVCWKNFFLHEVDSPNNPDRSVFSYATLGTTVAQTRVSPVDLDGGLIGVATVMRADNTGAVARAAYNLHIEGDRFTGTGGQVVDQIILPEQ